MYIVNLKCLDPYRAKFRMKAHYYHFIAERAIFEGRMYNITISVINISFHKDTSSPPIFQYVWFASSGRASTFPSDTFLKPSFCRIES